MPRDAAPAGIVAGLTPGLLRVLARSWRFREVGPDGAAAPPRYRAGGALYALWHRQLLMLMLRHRDEGIAVMISRSRDGDLASGVAARLGYRTPRGSSSRGGGEAMQEMVAEARAGSPLALTVDGPRGPAGRCKPGAVLIASRSGIPIVPAGAAPVRAWVARSWDRFVVPWPGTTVFTAYGEPLHVPPRLAPAEVATWQDRVDAGIEAATAVCRRAAGPGGDGAVA